MRISIPSGMEVTGKNGKYIIGDILSISERSTTALCKDTQNRQFRIKVFDGQNSISNESFRLFAEVKTRGMISLVDYGEFSGSPYFIYRNYAAKSVDQQVISINILVEKIIPQISYAINQIHSKKYLLRDIAAEHMLFDSKDNEIMFTGFGNYVKLQGKSTVSKANGYGQNHSYIAPEVEQYGYSTASDYFSLGVLLLSIVKGRNVILDVSQKVFYDGLKSGRVPGIDVEHLKNTPYEMYSVEDKVLYLILGLMIPNPNQRWGYGEIRCWRNNQFIPLVRKGNKVNYQYSMPLVLGNVSCWNDKQITECLANNNSLWNEETYKQVSEYLHSQKSSSVNDIDKIGSDDIGESKIFKIIYTLNPSIDGFWWIGSLYKDTHELVKAIKINKLGISELQGILRNNCFSYYRKCRFKIGTADELDWQEIQRLEQLEKISAGEGASRCIVLLAPNQERYFEIEGKKYNNFLSLLSNYKGNELKLKQLSGKIIKDSSFQAWLWSKGYEQLGKDASKSLRINDRNSFLIFLSVVEMCAENDKEKKLARELFVKYGDLAPVAWLMSNIKCYKQESLMNSNIYERFLNTKINLNSNIQELNQFLSDFVSDYQLFVQNTLDNPFVLEFGKDDSVKYDYYPLYESGFFSERWNGLLEVCPAFLNSINEQTDNSKIRDWLSACGNKQKDMLNELINRIDTKDTSDGIDYIQKCRKNISAAIVMLIIATILLSIGFNYSVSLGILNYVLAVVYPVTSIIWYYKKKVRAEIWCRTYKQQDGVKSLLYGQIQKISKREEEIYLRLVRNANSKCIVKDDSITVDTINLDSPEALDLSNGQRITAYLSTYGFVLLTTVVLGCVYSSFIPACLYVLIYGIGILRLCRKKQYIDSCFEWAIVTCTIAGISMVGGMAFGDRFFVTMNWIAVVIVIAFFVFVMILLI